MKAWTFRVNSYGNGLNICEDDSPIGVIYMTNNPKVAELRARMATAAPDLLEACKVVLAYLDKLESKPEPDFDPELSVLRRQFHAPLRAKLEPAIAKAEGAG